MLDPSMGLSGPVCARRRFIAYPETSAVPPCSVSSPPAPIAMRRCCSSRSWPCPPSMGKLNWNWELTDEDEPLCGLEVVGEMDRSPAPALPPPSIE